MTTEQALAALDLLISYSSKQARHTNADAALDVVRQALTGYDELRRLYYDLDGAYQEQHADEVRLRQALADRDALITRLTDLQPPQSIRAPGDLASSPVAAFGQGYAAGWTDYQTAIRAAPEGEDADA